MNVTYEEIKKSLMTIDVSYRGCFKEYSSQELQALSNIWYSIFKDTDSRTFNQALKLCITECKFAPTPADVMDRVDLLNNKTFVPSLIWNDFMETSAKEMYSCWLAWNDYDWQVRRKKFFDLWQGLDITLKLFFGAPKNLINVYELGEYAREKEKERYIKIADKIYNTLRVNTKLALDISNCRGKIDMIKYDVMSIIGIDAVKELGGGNSEQQ